jgi:hypothetical protein
MDDELYDVFIAKYYIGIYSVKKQLDPCQMTFITNTLSQYRNGLNGVSHQNKDIINTLHLAFIIGVVDASQPGHTRDTFYSLMQYYLTKVDRSKIPPEIVIPDH